MEQLKVVVVLACLLTAPLPASAESISVNPTEWYAEEVELGTTSTQVFDLVSNGPTELYVSDVFIDGDTSGSFLISDTTRIRENLDEGEKATVEVTFDPAGLGSHGAELVIESTAAEGPQIRIPLSGIGVAAPMPPGKLMEALIAYAKAAINDGTLVGNAENPREARQRLRAFFHELKAIDNLIEREKYDRAARKLWKLYQRADGHTPKPDLVAGEAVLDIAVMISELLDVLDAFGPYANGKDPYLAVKSMMNELDLYIYDGTLVGATWGNGDPDHRLDRFTDELDEAEFEWVMLGDTAATCVRLINAYVRSDGDPTPRDLVEGSATAKVNLRIVDFMDTLGCPY